MNWIAYALFLWALLTCRWRRYVVTWEQRSYNVHESRWTDWHQRTFTSDQPMQVWVGSLALAALGVTWPVQVRDCRIMRRRL